MQQLPILIICCFFSQPYGHSRGYMLVSLRFIPALGKIKVEIIEARHLFHYDSHSKRGARVSLSQSLSPAIPILNPIPIPNPIPSLSLFLHLLLSLSQTLSYPYISLSLHSPISPLPVRSPSLTLYPVHPYLLSLFLRLSLPPICILVNMIISRRHWHSGKISVSQS